MTLILEVPILCKTNECANNGTCLVEENVKYNQSYTCICDHGFYGSQCQYS